MSPLFAQVVIHTDPPIPPGGPTGIAFFFAMLMSCLLIGIPLVYVLRMIQRRREWDHAERMRMIEMGYPVAMRDGSAWPKALMCMAIGLGVPLVAFIFTAAIMQRSGDEALWIVPGLVSGGSVIAASVLAGHLFQRSADSDGADTTADMARMGAKAVMDPDAYDVAGQRG